MAKINEEQVRHVAHLARLAVTDEEVAQFTGQLEKILGFAEQLNELDTTGVEPTTHVLDLKNGSRTTRTGLGRRTSPRPSGVRIRRK